MSLSIPAKHSDFPHELPDSPNNIIFKIADNQTDLDQAFRLVYQCYIQKGYITRNASGLRIKDQHLVPGTALFVGKLAERVVATSSTFADSILSLPADSLFHTELNLLRTQGRKIVEMGALASHLEMETHAADVPFHVLQAIRIAYLYGRDYLHADDLIITVNPRHQSFYQKALLFEPISDVKTYEQLNGAPAIALRHNLQTIDQRLFHLSSSKGRLGQLRQLFFHQEIVNLDSLAYPTVAQLCNQTMVNYFNGVHPLPKLDLLLQVSGCLDWKK